MLKCLFILILVLPFYGCWALSYHQESVDSCIKFIAATRENYEAKYLGKSKEILLSDFGTPSVRENIFMQGVNYDEEWFYRTSGSWLQTDCAGAVWFYINDDKVAAVSVF